MVALLYMLDTTRVNGKTVWCLKSNSAISRTSSYDFSWNQAKALALPHIQRRSLNDLASTVQLKIKMFLRTAFLAVVPKPKVKRRFTGAGQRRRCQLHLTHSTQRQKRTMPPNQMNSVNHVVSVFTCNIQYEFAVVAYNETLFHISYLLCLAFRLFSSTIVFYTRLEVIKLAFLDNKSRYICSILANFIFTFEIKC